MEDENLKQAKAAYKTLCEMLDGDDWHYEADPEGLTITCSARGEDLSMRLKVCIDPKRLIIALYSPMPFAIPLERRKAAAIAVCTANHGIVDGNFDYDFTDGMICFRMTACYRDSIISKDLFEYMMYVSCMTIDEYNDKFLMVAKSNMSTQEILKFIGGRND